MESPTIDDNATSGERDSEKNNDEGVDAFIPLETFDSLKTGVIFENETIMKNSIKRWQDKFFMPFVVSKSETGRFSLKCPHAVERASRGTGKHKVQSINFTGCSALLNVRQQKNGTWKVTKYILKHSGHIISKVVYNSYRNTKKISKEDEEYIAELGKAKAKNRIIAERISEKTGKNFKTKDINNLLRKFGNSEEDTCLEKDLQTYITEGGDVQYRKDEDGYIDVLWIQTGYMKEAVTASQPRTFEVDTTFGTCEENYKLFIPLFKSKVTGKFEKAGILFLQTETKKNVELGLKFFKQSLPYTESDVGKFFFFLDKGRLQYKPIGPMEGGGINIYQCLRGG